MEELIEKFSLKHVGRSAGVFNPEKLLWLNEHYIKCGAPQRLGQLLLEYLERDGVTTAGGPDAAEVVKTLQDRSKTMVEMAHKAAFYYQDELEYDDKAVAKFFTAEQVPVFLAVKEALEHATFDAEGIENAFKQVLEHTGLKFGKIGQPTRVALSGGTSAPGIYEVALVLGRERCSKRLQRAIEMCSAPC